MAPWDSPPPPPPSWSIEMPGGSPYYIGLLFVILSQVICTPLCILAYQFKKGPAVLQYAVGLATAALPVFIQPYVAQYLMDNGYANEMDVLAGRFVGSSTYAFTAFRIFGAAAGGTPKGADASLDVWIAYATAAVDPLFDKDKGKPIRPKPGAIPSRLVTIVLRLLGLSIFSSLSKPFGGMPATRYLEGQGADPMLVMCGTYVFDYVLVQLMLIYLFLSVLMDVGALLLIAQNFEVLSPFENPLFSTRSPGDFWGKRWNIQVTTTLKRCCFVPLVKAGVSKSVAGIATFVFSGLFHEYQFLLSFPKYVLGSISAFFLMHAFIGFFESLWRKSFGTGWPLEKIIPEAAKGLIICIIFSPTIPYFTKIWIDEGMYDLMSLMAPQIKYG